MSELNTASNKICLSQLRLTNFRNYPSATFNFNSDVIVITGNNGAGKTNILEAITLLTKGRGLRGAELDEMIYNSGTKSNFTIYGEFINHPEINNIGTSYADKKRIFQVNNRIIDNIKIAPPIIWLTPQMDGIFLAPKNIRRRFLDRIASDIDQAHNTRLNSYDKLLRERMNLLVKFNRENQWLDSIERKIAELGTAIAISRNEAIDYLNRAIILNKSDFIKTRIKIIGELEDMALQNKAIFVEEKFAEKLRNNRQIDCTIGRTTFGIHRSEFTAILLNKDLDARFCSTGEQKSMLIALALARVEIFNFLGLPSAILLLDEIASHLDETKKSELFKEIRRLNVQSFLTGTQQEIFSDLKLDRNKMIQFYNIG